MELTNGNQFCAMKEFRRTISMNYEYILSYEKISKIKFNDCGSILLNNEYLKYSGKTIRITLKFEYSISSNFQFKSAYVNTENYL